MASARSPNGRGAARRTCRCARCATPGSAPLELELLLAAGLIEEDPRFGQVFEPSGRERRPSFGLLLAWWRGGDDGVDRAEAVRHSLLALLRTGLLQVLNPEAPRPEWLLVGAALRCGTDCAATRRHCAG